jgi:protein-tyrosine phosphatase
VDRIIDMHAHVLPGVDDGPSTLEESLDLLGRMAACGTDLCVAASHYNPPLYVLDNLEGRVAELSRAAEARGLDVEIRAGAEIALHAGLPDDVDSGQLITLGGGKAVLLEMPFSPLPPNFREFIFHTAARGFKPVLAHPERCPSFEGRPDQVRLLRESGALVQITAGSLDGFFGRAERRLSRTLLSEGLVDIIASDAHGRLGRPVDLRRAAEEAARFTQTQSQAWACVSLTPGRLLGLGPAD